MNGEGGSGGGAGSPSVKAWASGGDGGVAADVEAAYHAGFIEMYQVILRITAGLAFAGALMAILFVRGGRID
jgi:hypothetical protein